MRRNLLSPSGRRVTPTLAVLLISLFLPLASAEEQIHDIVIYGGSSGGVAAALQGARMGKSVVIIEPGTRLGGLTSDGLGQTDIGNKQAIGGISREFYARVAKHYSDPAAWTWQRREEYRDSGQTRTEAGEPTMWTFEPGVALQIFETMVAEAGIPVVYRERLDLKRGVEKQGARISAIRMESGRRFPGRVFIDATYEGDLMAKSGVSYTVGREAHRRYAETLNGVQTLNAKNHNLKPGIDPYRKKGDAASGLLPGIDPAGPGREGEGDRRVQAYCFRMCLTDHPENRIPFIKPAGYNEIDYELLLRNFEAGETRVPWINSSMPNRKTDTNNRAGFSTDFIGQNYEYPEADYGPAPPGLLKRIRDPGSLRSFTSFLPPLLPGIRTHSLGWSDSTSSGFEMRSASRSHVAFCPTGSPHVSCLGSSCSTSGE